MRKRLFAVLLLVVVLCALATAEETCNRYDEIFDASQDAGRLTARFLKLTTRTEDKSGDCTILTSPDGRVMVIDAGNPSCFVDVDNALRALRVKHIDYLVASHPHVDHVGSFAQLIYAYDVGAVYTSELVYPSPSYDDYMEAIRKTQTPHIILAEGDTFSFGKFVQVEVLHPGSGIEYYEGYPAQSTQFVNNHSLVLRLTYGESSFLFGGDLYTSAERDLVRRHPDKLDVDVFKVGHHGDSTSSTKSYRTAISPKIAVMMHDAIADLRIYRKYKEEGADTYITSIDGCVLVSTVGDGEYTVLTQYDRASNFLD